MQTFLTLVNEQQLNKLEQRQVFDSIKLDYEVLIKNFNEARKLEDNMSFDNELEVDV